MSGTRGAGGFELHPQLRADCHELGCLALCRVLLHKSAAIPWFILVPETPWAVTEWHELSAMERASLEADVLRVSRFLKARLGADKVNIAAIGNIVPQLHVHVVGRRRDDPCWPGVVWGRAPPAPRWPEGRPAQVFAELRAFAAGESDDA